MPCHLKHSSYCSISCKNESLKREKVVLTCTFCRNTYEVYQSVYKWSKLRAHRTNFCSRKCMNSYMTGSTNPRWIADRSKLKCRPNGNADYRKWRDEIFKRDNYTCVWCGSRNGNGKTVYLQADHIKQWALYPDLRLELSNGRTLCIECHKKTVTWRRPIKNRS